MWLSAKFVGGKFQSQTSHWPTANGCESYHAHLNADFYSAVLSQIFTYFSRPRHYSDSRHPRIFLSCHFVDAVTASSQEQQREVRISATHVGLSLHWLTYRTGCQSRKQYLPRIAYRYCPAWVFYSPLMTNFLDWYFHFTDRFYFAFRFGLLLFCYCMCVS